MKLSERLRRNAESKLQADHDGHPWTDEELAWLASWDGTEPYLAELAELLGRTIEACREAFYKRRRTGTWHQVIDVRVTTTYSGWTEADGDGW